ncbi:transcription factor Opi1-domain-containing protein [Xylariaceae sp. FL0255]|nr:transcription factor Opi1-domain-containing protein [Xylariaceae sp. FL0255]
MIQQPPRESRKHSLPSPDPNVGIFDQLDRPIKLPLYPPPPSYTQAHERSPLVFPDPTKTELPPIIKSDPDRKDVLGIHNSADTKLRTLPSLSSITASSQSSSPSSASTYKSPPVPAEPAYSPPAPPTATYWPSLNPLTAYYNPSHAEDAEPPMRMDVDTSSSSGASAPSPDRFPDGRASSVSLDDPDVRMAAEALGDLRADFVYSPKHKQTPPPGSPHASTMGPQPEPLLSLLTTSHPLLATTIEGATSAYNNSKNYSQRFKIGAEYVEGYVIPIANTVGSVGRVTGVEGGVRWFLQRRQSHGAEDGPASNKRRKVDSIDGRRSRERTPEPGSGAQTPRASMENSLCERRSSVASTIETLPAYDDLRSPPYVESGSQNHPQNRAWRSRLIMSTSGLSIAMSEESLRSLKYCLGWLRWANVHIGNVVNSLKVTMEKYEQSRQESADGDHPMQAEPVDRNQLAAKVRALRSDLLKTIQDAINTVSKYAGGALPENARELVRFHLTSFPQRFHLASRSSSADPRARSESSMEAGQEEQERMTRESAQLVNVLAKESLEMILQVSGVLDGTIVSAEEWCERLGRKKREQREELLGLPHVPQFPLDDTKMG